MSKTDMPANRQLNGGRLWLRKEQGISGYSSEDGNYDILINEAKGCVVLVSFIHDSVDDAEFWRRQFPTVDAAMEYAEKM